MLLTAEYNILGLNTIIQYNQTGSLPTYVHLHKVTNELGFKNTHCNLLKVYHVYVYNWLLLTVNMFSQ